MPRRSTGKSLLTILLAQSLAIYALVGVWSGTLSLATGAPNGLFAALCKASAVGNDGTTGPGNPRLHIDCLSLCVGVNGAAALPEEATIIRRARLIVTTQPHWHLHDVLNLAQPAPAFAARAPPESA